MSIDELRAAAEMVVATGMNKDWADSIDAGAVAVCRAWLAEHPEGDGEADLAAALAEVERLRARLAAIKTSWQDGVGQLDNPWRVRMAELIGDSEGLAELATLGGPPADDGEAVGWRPIETAPTIGDVLLFFSRGGYRLALPPMFRVGNPIDWPNRKPTCWMPLPEPPGDR
jgi:hypothetical protein